MLFLLRATVRLRVAGSCAVTVGVVVTHLAKRKLYKHLMGRFFCEHAACIAISRLVLTASSLLRR